MGEKQNNDLYNLKRATMIVNCLGFAVILFSLIKYNFSYSMILLLIGMAIMISSMITYGFGTCLHLMAETSAKSKGNGNNTYPRKDNIYSFLEKRRYYYK